MLAADMMGGEPSASLSTLLAAEQHVSPEMLVWDQQQGARTNIPWQFPQAINHLSRMNQRFNSNLPM